MILDEEAYLAHYGILRRSGRYPWQSGKDQYTRNTTFLSTISDLQKDGASESEVAAMFELTTTQLRATKTIAKNQIKAADIAMAQRLKDKGYSNVAIGKRMGKPESTVRTLLAPGAASTQDILTATSATLKAAVDTHKYVDIGAGVESYMGVSKERLKVAVEMLKEEGYTTHRIKTTQVATGHETDRVVLAGAGVTQKDVWLNRDAVRVPLESASSDGGRSYTKPMKPLSIDPKRVKVVWAEEGGDKADGAIYIREGATDLSLGGARYAQARIKVGDGHYLKGMAAYKKDLPPGVDIEFHTSKSRRSDKLDAMKPLEADPEFPFGAVVRQLVDNTGGGTPKVTSAVNILREEGDWQGWSKSVATQVLSKQPPSLARDRLDAKYRATKEDFDSILALTNPTVKAHLLSKFADTTDASAVHLKAAAFPRQRWQVLMPLKSLPDTEIYAPNYKDGERVALIRYPHGGIFEIPELTVNNRNKEGREILGSAAKDAVGINSSVAARMSGADFDGDTVLVIPNNSGRLKTKGALSALKGFDPIRAYPAYEGMPKMKKSRLGQEMGDISNLITDMTIRGATDVELASAIKHSMVVIDSYKHKLNYRQSAIDNGILTLKKKYQGRSNAGASTLISRATSPAYVPERKLRPQALGGPIDPKTGARLYVPTGRTTRNKAGERVEKLTKVPKLELTDDARTLMSEGRTQIESVYADHSNRLKALANQARLEQMAVKHPKRSPTAAKTYANEVTSLRAKLELSNRNRPLERQAQTLANAAIRQRQAANPDMTADQLKKVKFQELNHARAAVGSDKQSRSIEITPKEWEAIQAGAVSTNQLNQILTNTDIDVIRSYATPKVVRTMTPERADRAKDMLNSGYTRSEIAQVLGVSITTLNNSLKEA